MCKQPPSSHLRMEHIAGAASLHKCTEKRLVVIHWPKSISMWWLSAPLVSQQRGCFCTWLQPGMLDQTPKEGILLLSHLSASGCPHEGRERSRSLHRTCLQQARLPWGSPQAPLCPATMLIQIKPVGVSSAKISVNQRLFLPLPWQYNLSHVAEG